jgi:hypothetical protein
VTIDPQTAYALRILRGVVAMLPERKPARALAHLERAFGAGAGTTPPTNMVTRATKDDEPRDPGVQPSASELAQFVRAVRAASRHGLTLPPDACRFVWFDKDEPGDVGGFVHLKETPPCVWLARGLSDGELFVTVLHELKHVQDLVTLGEQYFDLPYDERERRARVFESAVLAHEGLPGGIW